MPLLVCCWLTAAIGGVQAQWRDRVIDSHNGNQDGFAVNGSAYLLTFDVYQPSAPDGWYYYVTSERRVATDNVTHRQGIQEYKFQYLKTSLFPYKHDQDAIKARGWWPEVNCPDDPYFCSEILVVKYNTHHTLIQSLFGNFVPPENRKIYSLSKSKDGYKYWLSSFYAETGAPVGQFFFTTISLTQYAKPSLTHMVYNQNGKWVLRSALKADPIGIDPAPWYDLNSGPLFNPQMFTVSYDYWDPDVSSQGLQNSAQVEYWKVKNQLSNQGFLVSLDNEFNWSVQVIAKIEDITNLLMPVFLLSDYKSSFAVKYEDRFSCCGGNAGDPVYLPEKAVFQRSYDWNYQDFISWMIGHPYIHSGGITSMQPFSNEVTGRVTLWRIAENTNLNHCDWMQIFQLDFGLAGHVLEGYASMKFYGKILDIQQTMYRKESVAMLVKPNFKEGYEQPKFGAKDSFLITFDITSFHCFRGSIYQNRPRPKYIIEKDPPDYTEYDFVAYSDPLRQHWTTTTIRKWGLPCMTGSNNCKLVGAMFRRSDLWNKLYYAFDSDRVVLKTVDWYWGENGFGQGSAKVLSTITPWVDPITKNIQWGVYVASTIKHALGDTQPSAQPNPAVIFDKYSMIGISRDGKQLTNDQSSFVSNLVQQPLTGLGIVTFPRNCFQETFGTNGDKVLYFQLNKTSMPLNFILSDSIPSLFQNPLSCSITKWFLTQPESTLEVTAVDPIYTKVQASYGLVSDKLVANYQSLAQTKTIFQFRVRVMLDQDFLHMNSVLFTLHVGCYSVFRIDFNPVLDPIPDPRIINSTFEGNWLNLTVYRDMTPMNIDLNQYFSIATEYSFCSAERVLSFEDEARKIPTTVKSPSYLEENPEQVDELTQKFNLTLKVNQLNLSQSDVYLRAERSSTHIPQIAPDPNSPIFKNFNIEIKYFCGIIKEFVSTWPIDKIEVPRNRIPPSIKFGFKPDNERCQLEEAELVALDHDNNLLSIDDIANVNKNLAGVTKIKLLDTNTIRIVKFYAYLYSGSYRSELMQVGQIKVAQPLPSLPVITPAELYFNETVLVHLGAFDPLDNLTSPHIDLLKAPKFVSLVNNSILNISESNEKSIGFHEVWIKLTVPDRIEIGKNVTNVLLFQVKVMGYQGPTADEEMQETNKSEALNETDRGNDEKTAAKFVAKEKKKHEEEMRRQNQELLRDQGFTQISNLSGNTFPGIDPAEVDRLLALKDQRKEEPQRPSFVIKKVTQQGLAWLQFTQPTFAPNTINQAFYSASFRVGIEFYSVEKIKWAKFGKIPGETSNQTLRMLKTGFFEMIEAFELYAQVKAHSEDQIELKLEMNMPELVSLNPEKDELVVEVLQPSVFKSKVRPFLTMEAMKSKNGQNALIRARIPPQLERERRATIKVLTDTIGGFFASLAPTNLLKSVFLFGSMQFLFGLIRTVQLIIIMGLIRVSLPSQALFFFKECMFIAQIDYMDGAPYYSEILTFKETEAINENYEELDMESLNFVLNSGGFFIWIAIFTLISLLKKVAHWWLVKLAKYKTARLVSFKLKTEERSIVTPFKVLVIETYYDMALATFLMVYAFIESGDKFGEFFNTVTDGVCSVMTLIYLVMVVVLPFAVSYKLKKAFDAKSLRRPKTKLELEVFYDDQKITSIHTVLFDCYFLMRRLLTVIVLVYLDQYPFFQCAFLTIFSTINFIYAFSTQPLLLRSQNNLEVFNEGCILVTCHIFTLLLNTIPEELRQQLGLTLIIVISLSFGVNLGWIIVETVYECFKNHQTEKKEEEKVKYVDQYFEAQKRLLAKDADGKLKGLQTIKDQREALEFCIEWKPHRQWLLRHKKDVSGFEEEEKYQTYMDKYQFNLQFIFYRRCHGLHSIIEDEVLRDRSRRAVQLRKQKGITMKSESRQNGSDSKVNLAEVNTQVELKVVGNSKKVKRVRFDIDIQDEEEKKQPEKDLPQKDGQKPKSNEQSESEEESDQNKSSEADVQVESENSQNTVKTEIEVKFKGMKHKKFFEMLGMSLNYEETTQSDLKTLVSQADANNNSDAKNVIKVTQRFLDSHSFKRSGDTEFLKKFLPLHKLGPENDDQVGDEDFQLDLEDQIYERKKYLREVIDNVKFAIPFRETASNNLVSSILQCLTCYKPLNEFLALEFNGKSPPDQDWSMCMLLYEMLCNNLDPDLSLFQLDLKHISVEPVAKYLRSLSEDETSLSYCLSLMDRLRQELNQDPQSQKFLLDKLDTQVVEYHNCKGSNSIHLTKTISVFQVPNGKSLKKCLKKYFKSKTYCPQCRKEVTLKKKVQKLAELVIFAIDPNLTERTQLPQMIDFKKKMDPTSSFNSELSYSPLGFVGLDPASENSSDAKVYSCIAKKTPLINPDKEYSRFYRMYSQSVISVAHPRTDQAKMTPVLAFYQRNPKGTLEEKAKSKRAKKNSSIAAKAR